MVIHHLSITNSHRLLMGDVGWLFTIEVVFRTVFVYLLLLTLMRLMGKRLAAGLSITELAVILTLGAAVGLPLQSVKQGLLPSVVVLLVGLIFQRGLSGLSFWSRRLETISLGDVIVLVRDGRLLMDELHTTQLSNAKLFAALRSQGVLHLGQLRRVYLEASGQFSMILMRQPQPGLSIMPKANDGLVGLIRHRGHAVCGRCGYCPEDGKGLKSPCLYCGSWEREDVVSALAGAKQAQHREPRGGAQAGDGPM